MTTDEVAPHVIRRAQDGDEFAFDAICAHFRGYIEHEAWQRRVSTYHSWLDTDDLRQEGRIGLWQIVRTFRHRGDRPFAPVACLYIGYYMNNALTVARAKKHFCDATSLEMPFRSGDDEVTLSEIIPDPRPVAGLARVLVLDQLAELRPFLAQHLSAFQTQVVLHDGIGFSVPEIATALGRSDRAVRGALYKARQAINSARGTTRVSRPLGGDLDRHIGDLYAEGLTCAEIGTLVGLSVTQTRFRLVNSGVTLRSRGRRQELREAA